MASTTTVIRQGCCLMGTRSPEAAKILNKEPARAPKTYDSSMAIASMPTSYEQTKKIPAHSVVLKLKHKTRWRRP